MAWLLKNKLFLIRLSVLCFMIIILNVSNKWFTLNILLCNKSFSFNYNNIFYLFIVIITVFELNIYLNKQTSTWILYVFWFTYFINFSIIYFSFMHVFLPIQNISDCLIDTQLINIVFVYTTKFKCYFWKTYFDRLINMQEFSAFKKDFSITLFDNAYIITLLNSHMDMNITRIKSYLTFVLLICSHIPNDPKEFMFFINKLLSYGETNILWDNLFLLFRNVACIISSFKVINYLFVAFKVIKIMRDIRSIKTTLFIRVTFRFAIFLKWMLSKRNGSPFF